MLSPTHPPPLIPATGDNLSPLEARTRELGREVLSQARAHQHTTLFARLFSDRLLATTLRDPRLKTQLFRFIDVFPALRTPEAIRRHLQEYLVQPDLELPTVLATALRAGGLFQRTFASAITAQVEAMAANFIGGRDLAAALPTLLANWEHNIAFSVDLLGEACLSAAEARAYHRRYAELLAALPAALAGWPAQPVLEFNHLGPIPRANISLKMSSLDPHPRPADPDATVARLAATLRPLLETARERNIFLNFDMEQYAYKDLTLALFRHCCQQVAFPAGIAIQAYLRSADDDVAALIDWTHRTGRQITVRLIKGAYWDYESAHAQLMGWPCPVWSHKAQTDACFERLTRLLIDQTPTAPNESGILLAVGSHNARSIAHALAAAEGRGLPASALEFQLLRGMADELKLALVARGLRVREYVPLGDLIPGMAYLVRRLLENTSNESWLRAGFLDHADDATLLAPPTSPPAEPPARDDTFRNLPPRDFSDPAQRTAFAHAVGSATLPPSPTGNWTLDTGHSSLISRATAAFPAWSRRPPAERSAIIARAADLLEKSRDQLAAAIILESGKTWPEADADVCEAIDFCRFYARCALTPPAQPASFPLERNDLRRLPRGLAAVISPWNFPLSIPTGMTLAALVTGNCAILKPAEQTPRIAAALCAILHSAGVPADVLQLAPGPGETLGAALVRHPAIALIAFTGSRAVGFDILAASTPNPNSPILKHVVCEMGGKNAIIIDATADLDDAVRGVLHSAFSYAGQKCSACSRVIALAPIHDLFAARLIEAARSLTVGDPLSPSTDLGPVIDSDAADKIRHYIALGQRDSTLALASPITGTVRGKPLIGPHIFTHVPPTSPLATDEIFGPVLAIFSAPSFDDALALANASPYKLTGGLYSRTPSHLAQARQEFRVGNLYLNRPITGALVNRHPFGGFGHSGLGTKAGSPEYLQNFTLPVATSEDTLRHGLVPEA